MQGTRPRDHLRAYLDRAPLALAIWRSREAHALDEVEIEPPVLDLGCGFGEFAGVFFDSALELGVDISRRDLALAIEGGRFNHVLRADARSLPVPDASIGTVLSVSVLEHIADLAPVFREASRILRPGGRFVFTVPTTDLNREMAVPRLAAGLRTPAAGRLYRRLYHALFKHVSVLSGDGWRRLCEDAGLRVDSVRGTHSRRSLSLFEVSLPLAIPSQVARTLFGRRLVVAPEFMRAWLARRLAGAINEPSDSMANVLVVASKP